MIDLVINHGSFSVTVLEVHAQWVSCQEHPPIASPSLVVVQLEVFGVTAGEVISVVLLVNATIALTSRHQVTAPLMLASMGRLMWHLS